MRKKWTCQDSDLDSEHTAGATGRQGIISWSQLYRFRCPCCSFNLYWLYNDNFWDGGLLLSSFIIADIFTKFSLNRLIALLMFITVITNKSTYNINFFFLISRHFIKHVVTITTLYIYVHFQNSQSHSNNNRYDKFQDGNRNITPPPKKKERKKNILYDYVPTLWPLLKIASSFRLVRRIFFHLCSIVRLLVLYVILFILRFVIWISFKRIRQFCSSHQMYEGTQATKQIIILMISIRSAT